MSNSVLAAIVCDASPLYYIDGRLNYLIKKHIDLLSNSKHTYDISSYKRSDYWVFYLHKKLMTINI